MALVRRRFLLALRTADVHFKALIIEQQQSAPKTTFAVVAANLAVGWHAMWYTQFGLLH